MKDLFGRPIKLTKPVIISKHALERFIERFSACHDEKWFTNLAMTELLIHKNLEEAEICVVWKTDPQEVERVNHLYGPSEVYKYNGIHYIIAEDTDRYVLVTVVKHWSNEAQFANPTEIKSAKKFQNLHRR